MKAPCSPSILPQTNNNACPPLPNPKGAIATTRSRPGHPRPPVRVLIADDHDLVRQGVRALLSAYPESFVVCGEASSGLDAIEMARHLRPDVVVIDVSMPGLNGLEATRLLSKEVPSARVLILSMHESEYLVRELLSVGAAGYVMKSDGARDLPLAIESLAARRPFFSSEIARKVLDGYLKNNVISSKSPLTPAERRVTQLLAEGKSNKEVANIQGISVKTAETHRASIMRKLGLRSVSDIVHYAVRNDMIEA
jgi:DNA-binding NarL/FixJ family response regulator